MNWLQTQALKKRIAFLVRDVKGLCAFAKRTDGDPFSLDVLVFLDVSLNPAIFGLEKPVKIEKHPKAILIPISQSEPPAVVVVEADVQWRQPTAGGRFCTAMV